MHSAVRQELLKIACSVVFAKRELQLSDHVEDDGLFLVGTVVYNVLDVRIVLCGEDIEVVVHQAVDGGLQRVRDGRDGHQREFRMVVFDVADVGDSQFRTVRKLFLGESQFLTGSPDPNSDGAVIQIVFHKCSLYSP